MDIRKRIFVPMITLTVTACAAVLLFAMLLYNKETKRAMHDKNSIAISVVEHEISYMQSKATLAALGIANNQDLKEAVLNSDRSEITAKADALLSVTQLDYCVIVNSRGIIMASTHDPDNYGYDASALLHVKSALSGKTEAHIIKGPTILLGISAGGPIYDDNKNVIGAVTLGFRLDRQEFVHRLKAITGCEISVFSNDERISTTVMYEDGTPVIGTKAAKEISEKVLSGESYSGKVQIFGKNVLGRYSPLYGTNDEIVGKLFAGFYTAEDTKKSLFFIFTGILITLAVLAVCLMIARFISRTIERRLENMVAKIKDQAHWYESILDATPLPITVTDANMNWTFVNKAVENFLGTRREEMMGKPCSNWNAHICNTSECGIACAKRGLKQTFFNHEGNSYMVNVEILKNLNNETTGFIEVVQDITHIREHEARLAEMHEQDELKLTKLNLVVKATKIGLWDMEINNSDPANPANAFMWSDEFRQMLGYSNEKDFPNILSSWSDLLHPDDKEKILYAFTRHLLDVTGQTPYDVEYRLLKRNGEYSYYYATGETVRDTDGHAIYTAGALMDITEEKNNLIAINRMREMAETANRTKSAFLANMSHEIRTPMNSIIGFSELAMYGDASKKTREYLSNIKESAEWLLSIINDILDISKIESGKIELENIPFDLPDIFAHCHSVILPKAREKGITLYCYAEPSVGKKLLGDPIRLRQVLINLLSNAVKFTNVGAVKLFASIKNTGEDQITIHFEIKDSGIGMSPANITKIFEPFMQADSSITRKFGGTGLGLTITKSIIELMGGALFVESTVGVGSKFSFELTFAMIDDVADISSQQIIINDFKKPEFKGHVLICEDNSLNQQVICDHLARVGLNTTVAYNGKEGVNIIDECVKSGGEPFDLILMDIHMPVMDGLEAASKITALGIKTPIVALTANIMSNDLELYKVSGMSDYLGKPFTSQELWKCLIKYIPVESYSDIDKHLLSDEEEKLQKKLKINFVRSNQTACVKIAEAVKDGDIKLAHRLAHTLKSNAGQIGKKQLQSAAAAAEAMLCEGENLLTERHMRNLETELQSVLDELAPLLLEVKPKKGTETVTAEKLSELLDKLEPLLKTNNTACLNFLDELYAVPGANELVYQIEEYEFKLAAATLENLKKKLTATDE